MTRRRPIVGMVGAGQLARMSYEASIALDVRLRILASDRTDSAALVASEVMPGSGDDLDALVAFADTCDVVTFDHELVPPEHLKALAAARHLMRPDPEALRFAQDKGHQRAAFADLGLPVPPFVLADTPEAVRDFATEHGWPVVLKAPRGGYDGRGVWVAQDSRAVDRIWVQTEGISLLAEPAVAIEQELAALVARRPGGQTCTYSVVETVQRDGICTEMVVPARVDEAVRAQSAELGVQIAEAIGVTGVLAVEFFWTGAELLVNEVATRPHNSGHWTIEGARTSQFANHLRAVMDWPLGSTAMNAPAVATVNLLGPPEGEDPAQRLPAALAVPGVAVHLYGKAPRPGRKLGHVTVLAEHVEEAREHAWKAAGILSGQELR